MKKPERSNYTTLDFIEWHQSGGLKLSPKFQRRGVWTSHARSYLIDSILLGIPIPPIFLRVTQNTDRTKIIREVIDGQQRLSAVLDYKNDKFGLSKRIESDSAGKYYSELSNDQQNQISEYPFICEVFYGIEDKDVLQLFARLNTYSVKLNSQELRNGKYFGPFKQLSYKLAYQYLEFWRNNKIFSEQNIARMLEVELTSELLIVQLAGMQDKKKSIDTYYEKYDDNFFQKNEINKRFKITIDIIDQTCNDFLKTTEFRRPPIFYSLFSAIYHRLFGIENLEIKTPKTGHISTKEKDSLSSAIRTLSEVIENAKTNKEFPEKYSKFINACLRQTDNIKPRQTRTTEIYKIAF